MTDIITLRAELDAAHQEIARLRAALTSVRALEAMLNPPLHVIDPDADLTSREYETLELLTAGCSNDDIALAMFVSPSTVRTHVAHLFRQMHVHTGAAAAVVGIGLGLITTMDTTYYRTFVSARLADGVWMASTPASTATMDKLPQSREVASHDEPLSGNSELVTPFTCNARFKWHDAVTGVVGSPSRVWQRSLLRVGVRCRVAGNVRCHAGGVLHRRPGGRDLRPQHELGVRAMPSTEDSAPPPGQWLPLH